MQIQWKRINDEPFEYAIQQGPHGDEFVKLDDGSCLRRDALNGAMLKRVAKAMEAGCRGGEGYCSCMDYEGMARALMAIVREAGNSMFEAGAAHGQSYESYERDEAWRKVAGIAPEDF